MQDIEQITSFSIVRTGYESTMRGFYQRLREERKARMEAAGNNNWTDEEALLP